MKKIDDYELKKNEMRMSAIGGEPHYISGYLDFFMVSIDVPKLIFLKQSKPGYRDLTIKITVNIDIVFSFVAKSQFPSSIHQNINTKIKLVMNSLGIIAELICTLKVVIFSKNSFKLDGLNQIEIVTEEDTQLIFYCETEAGLIGGYLFETDDDVVHNFLDNRLESFENISFKSIFFIKLACIVDACEIKKGRYIFVPIAYLFLSIFNFLNLNKSEAKTGCKYSVLINSPTAIKSNIIRPNKFYKELALYENTDNLLRKEYNGIIAKQMFEKG